MHLSRVLLSSLLVLPLAALELDELSNYVDMRLGYGTAPLKKNKQYMMDTEPASPLGEVDSTDFTSTDHAPTYSLGVVSGSKTTFGPAFGLEFVHTNGWQKAVARNLGGAVQNADGSTPDLHWRSSVLNLLVGIDSCWNQHLHGELLAFVGGGRARFDTWNNTMTYTREGGGWQSEMGVRAATYYTFTRFQVGVSADWGTYEVHDGYTAGENAHFNLTKTTWNGYSARLEVGFRLQ